MPAALRCQHRFQPAVVVAAVVSIAFPLTGSPVAHLATVDVLLPKRLKGPRPDAVPRS